MRKAAGAIVVTKEPIQGSGGVVIEENFDADATPSSASSKETGVFLQSPSEMSDFADVRPLKKRKVTARVEPMYPFFGNQLPQTPKILALRCLEYLDGKSIYAMSLVNRLWSKASMDDALWESNDD